MAAVSPRLQILDASSPVPPQLLLSLEDELGVPLPPPYRRFLLRHNGGRPQPAGFRSSAFCDERLRCFYPADELASVWRRLRELLPIELLPIATDDSGNQVCIGVGGGLYGRVVFWERDRDADLDPPVMADDFDGFLDGFFDVALPIEFDSY